jgi:predicted nucleic acid-binding Zn ribbon protein
VSGRREPRSGKGKPAPIAEAIKDVLASRGLDADVARAWVIEAWPSIVGRQIAAVTTPRVVMDDGTLVVGVRTHGWMSELSMMERALVAKVNAASGGSAVRKIRWELLR